MSSTISPIVLQFNDVSFSYPKLSVLQDVSFHIHQGEFIALVGPNGSGKTTLLKLILGLEDAQKGSISLLGATPKQRRSQIGYVPQHASYDPSFPISVAEVVAMGQVDASRRNRRGIAEEAVREALAQVELEDLYGRPYSELSGGQRRRVLVARALIGNPEMLILDEPTANMDKVSEERLYATLGSLKGERTILIVTHDMRHVSALTDRVFCINALKRGSARTVVQHPLAQIDAETKEVLHDEYLSADLCMQEGV
ncbi:MAG TPA: metal ABC transporter ATP-binding protein [Sphaerochaeta sp.]|nr:metal ABC transporter ATP-binding protein [Sphaerochaeta sp.]